MRQVKVGLILALATVVRLWGSGQSFWLDEAAQAQMSKLTVAQIWFGRGGDFHPPLFYLLTHFWQTLGSSEIFLRLPSIFFGVATVAVIMLLAKKLFANFNLTLLAGFFLAINPYHVYYSQEYRMYSLLALLGTLSMYLLVQKKYLWMALVNTVMLYTHYLGGLLILTQFFIAPVTMYYAVITLLLYVPWLPQMVKQLHNGVNIDTYLPGWRSLLSETPVRALPVIVFKFIAGRINFLSKIWYGIYIVFVFGLVAWSAVVAKMQRKFLWMWFGLPIVFAIVLSLVIPVTEPFRLLYCLPALVLVVVQLAHKYPRLGFALLLYSCVAGLVMYQTRPRLQREEWRQAGAYLQSTKTANSLVLVKFADRFAPMAWYTPDLPVLGVVPNYPAQPADVALKLKSLDLNIKKVYVLDYLVPLTDPQNIVDTALSDLGFAKKDVKNFEGVGPIALWTR